MEAEETGSSPASANQQHRVGPRKALPYSDHFETTEDYLESLLNFVGTNELLRTLCGGVHILDFFTSTPSIYDRILPQDWREWFAAHDISDTLDLLMRQDLSQFDQSLSDPARRTAWRDEAEPPVTLLDYIKTVRKHLLNREPSSTQCSRNRSIKPFQKLARHVAVGMNVKKVHEVGLFASYMDKLVSDLEDVNCENVTHLVDFGSGQNYLGRALASDPYNKNIVAVESKQANADRAKELDVFAKLSTKQQLMRNKKAFRDGLEGPGSCITPRFVDPPRPPEPVVDGNDASRTAPTIELPTKGRGKIQYVEHRILDGDLTEVIEHIPAKKKALVVMSLHSCGNLVHHGLRSLIMNQEVKAVAMVGCCYNLVTERLGPATYKLPELRPTTHEHPRLTKLGEANDPHGFPMSRRFCNYYDNSRPQNEEKGVRLNITSRMMAVQAPANWGTKDSESFFTRHFYRALLQRIFLDRGVVSPPTPECVGGRSPAGHSSGGTPIVIGSLRKACYESFVSYVRGAVAKLVQDSDLGDFFREKMGGISDAEIENYEIEYGDWKKNLSVIWSLMAFSAGVIEATIVVDRWLWLMEQEQVQEAWIEPVFDYKMSPRNLVIVGIKK